MSDLKRCTACGEWKSLNEYSPCRGGVQSACRSCRNLAASRMQRNVSLETQECVACKKTLAASSFARNRRRRCGLQKECKACCNERKKALCYPVTLAEKRCRDCDKTKEAAAFCRDKKRVGGLRSECRVCTSVRTRAQVYRLPLAAAAAMCAVELCEICGGQLRSVGDRHIDHCHSTGVVRGTLCGDCNHMIGYGRDSARILRLGAEYVARHSAATGVASG